MLTWKTRVRKLKDFQFEFTNIDPATKKKIQTKFKDQIFISIVSDITVKIKFEAKFSRQRVNLGLNSNKALTIAKP